MSACDPIRTSVNIPLLQHITGALVRTTARCFTRGLERSPRATQGRSATVGIGVRRREFCVPSGVDHRLAQTDSLSAAARPTNGSWQARYSWQRWRQVLNIALHASRTMKLKMHTWLVESNISDHHCTCAHARPCIRPRRPSWERKDHSFARYADQFGRRHGGGGTIFVSPPRQHAPRAPVLDFFALPLP
jgi:hypothetical protein